MTTQKSDKEEQIDLGRREALKNVGRLAAYTPPAMMSLMISKQASAGSPVVEQEEEEQEEQEEQEAPD